MKPSAPEQEGRDHKVITEEIFGLCVANMDNEKRREEVDKRCRELGQIFIPPAERPGTADTLHMIAIAPETDWGCSWKIGNLVIHLRSGIPKESGILIAGK